MSGLFFRSWKRIFAHTHVFVRKISLQFNGNGWLSSQVTIKLGSVCVGGWRCCNFKEISGIRPKSWQPKWSFMNLLSFMQHCASGLSVVIFVRFFWILVVKALHVFYRSKSPHLCTVQRAPVSWKLQNN